MANNVVQLDSKRRAVAVQAMREYHHLLKVDNGVLPRIDEFSELVPVEKCQAIVERIDAEHAPAGESRQTTEAVHSLVGGFPQSMQSADRMENPNIYLAHVVRVYSKYPAALHERVTNEILERFIFRPAVAEIREVFEEAVSRWTYAQIIAERHLREHERRRKEAEREALLADEHDTRDEFIEELRRRFGNAAVGFVENLEEGSGKPKARKVKTDDEVDLQSFGQDRDELDRKAAELLRGADG